MDITLHMLVYKYIGKYIEYHRFVFCGLFSRLYFIFVLQNFLINMIISRDF